VGEIPAWPSRAVADVVDRRAGSPSPATVTDQPPLGDKEPAPAPVRVANPCPAAPLVPAAALTINDLLHGLERLLVLPFLPALGRSECDGQRLG
jgi:hypothetical protein